jgi:putative ABC transport system permease protein
MLRLLPLILRNLLRNRRRTLLTLASTAMSLGILALLFAIYQSFFHGDDTSPASALRIACRHKVSLTQWLPASYEAKIKAVDGVEQISTWSWFGGLYKNDSKNFFGRFAVDADTVLDIYKDWKVPPDEAAAFKSMRSGCLVARKIADRYGIHLGDKVVIIGDIYPVTLDLTCVAISDNPLNEENLVFHREYLSELLKAQGTDTRDMVGMYMIRAHSADSVPRISKAIDAMFEDSPYPTRTESEKEFGRSFLGMLGNIKMFLAAIVAAVTFTILLVSANTVAMAVRERTREMAILRTLGFNPDEILQLIVGEAILISIIGGLFGLGIGYLLSQGIQSAGGFGFQGMKWQAAAAVLGIAALLGLVSALVPALITSRKNIVESLRFTG